jgi:hypothetical protein
MNTHNNNNNRRFNSLGFLIYFRLQAQVSPRTYSNNNNNNSFQQVHLKQQRPETLNEQDEENDVSNDSDNFANQFEKVEVLVLLWKQVAKKESRKFRDNVSNCTQIRNQSSQKSKVGKINSKLQTNKTEIRAEHGIDTRSRLSSLGTPIEK